MKESLESAPRSNQLTSQEQHSITVVSLEQSPLFIHAKTMKSCSPYVINCSSEPESVNSRQTTWLETSCSLTENAFLLDPQMQPFPVIPHISPGDPSIHTGHCIRFPYSLPLLVLLNLTTAFEFTFNLLNTDQFCFHPLLSLPQLQDSPQGWEFLLILLWCSLRV